jgi:hypothetical protein
MFNPSVDRQPVAGETARSGTGSVHQDCLSPIGHQHASHLSGAHQRPTEAKSADVMESDCHQDEDVIIALDLVPFHD